MNVYVVSLSRATEQRRKMQEQTLNHGVPAQFVDAIDGRVLGSSAQRAVEHQTRRSISPYFLTANEIACWLSHREALRVFLNTGETSAAILEDDAIMLNGFKSVILALEYHTHEYDLVTLHRNYHRREWVFPGAYLTDQFRLSHIGPMQTGNVGYVVSRSGALKLCAYLKSVSHSIDKEMHRYWVNGLRIYGLSEPIVVHDDNGYSYIDETRSQHRRDTRRYYPDSGDMLWRIRRSKTKIAEDR